MTKFRTLIAKYHGWIEGDWIRFPSPWHKAQFEREWAAK